MHIAIQPPLRHVLEYLSKSFDASAKLAIREGANGAIHNAIRFDAPHPRRLRVFRSAMTGRTAVVQTRADDPIETDARRRYAIEESLNCPTAARIFRG